MAANRKGRDQAGRAVYERTREGKLDVVKALVKDGAQVNYADQHGNTPLMAAIWEGHAALFRFLVARGALVSGRNKFGFTPLVLAVHYERIPMVKALLAHGAPINETYRLRVADGRATKNPLLAAVQRGNAALVALLLRHGADPLIVDGDGRTLLEIATSQDATKVLRVLQKPRRPVRPQSTKRRSS
jgi:ankyrin repeat protein